MLIVFQQLLLKEQKILLEVLQVRLLAALSAVAKVASHARRGDAAENEVSQDHVFASKLLYSIVLLWMIPLEPFEGN